MNLYLPPAAPPGAEITPSYRYRIMWELQAGHIGLCCVCHGPSRYWWSATPPSAFVPLHDSCAPELVRRWIDGDTVEEDVVESAVMRRVSGGRGMYGRIKATASRDPAIPAPAPSLRGATLPEGFVPGPYWMPGDDGNTPWVALLETTTGHVVSPSCRSRERAARVVERYRMAPPWGGGMVLGGAVIAPDGSALDTWGSVPVPGRPRWEGIQRLSMWARCTGCGELRWPGSWVTVTAGRCAGCTRESETEDPRQWPPDPPHPGQNRIPEQFTKEKRVTPPKQAKVPVRTLRSRYKTG